MDSKLLVLEIKRFVDTDGAGSAQFFSKGLKLVEPPTVACSRNGNSCYTPIDNLQAHNKHVPQFATKSELDAWVNRIKHDVELAADEYEGGYIPGASDPELN